MRFGLENYSGFSQAYVVFEDNTSLWWLRFLRRGFRHCYLILACDDCQKLLWLNPLSNQLAVQLLDYDDPQEIIRQMTNDTSITICRVHIVAAPLRCAPLMAFTCVEFVKRVLGIHSIKTITPYQLYKIIKECRK